MKIYLRAILAIGECGPP